MKHLCDRKKKNFEVESNATIFETLVREGSLNDGGLFALHLQIFARSDLFLCAMT